MWQIVRVVNITVHCLYFFTIFITQIHVITNAIVSPQLARRELPPTPLSDDDSSDLEDLMPEVPKRTCSRQNSRDGSSSQDTSDTGEWNIPGPFC